MNILNAYILKQVGDVVEPTDPKKKFADDYADALREAVNGRAEQFYKSRFVELVPSPQLIWENPSTQQTYEAINTYTTPQWVNYGAHWWGNQCLIIDPSDYWL
jgi:hypothetical protein